jgi:hypothetical protein
VKYRTRHLLLLALAPLTACGTENQTEADYTSQTTQEWVAMCQMSEEGTRQSVCVHCSEIDARLARGDTLGACEEVSPANGAAGKETGMGGSGGKETGMGGSGGSENGMGGNGGSENGMGGSGGSENGMGGSGGSGVGGNGGSETGFGGSGGSGVGGSGGSGVGGNGGSETGFGGSGGSGVGGSGGSGVGGNGGSETGFGGSGGSGVGGSGGSGFGGSGGGFSCGGSGGSETGFGGSGGNGSGGSGGTGNGGSGGTGNGGSGGTGNGGSGGTGTGGGGGSETGFGGSGGTGTGGSGGTGTGGSGGTGTGGSGGTGTGGSGGTGTGGSGGTGNGGSGGGTGGYTCEETIGHHCNTFDGSGDFGACMATNPAGCSQDYLYAWCHRRDPAMANYWGTYDYWEWFTYNWVATQCDGTISAINHNNGRFDWACTDSAGNTWTCSTPLVLVFDGRPVSFQSAEHGFSLTADGVHARTDWPSSATPWLVMDRNGNGRIDDGSELFGSASPLSSGRTASHGFEALAALDDNADGVVDTNDAAWDQLMVWRDEDGNGVSDPGELRRVADVGLLSISLDYRVEPRCDARGNCERERATFQWRDGNGQVHTGETVDIHLPLRSASCQ